MKWQFWKNETRAEVGYTDAFVAALLGRAQGKTLAVPVATGALESCAGTVGRAFMACEVAGRPALVDALTPGCLEIIGRSLIRRGESVWRIDTTGGNLTLLPAETWSIEGEPNPASWEYRLTLGGPSRTFTYDYVPFDSVLHFRYAVDPERPWHGNGPIMVASLAGNLSAETMAALGDEASGPRGSLLGLPVDGADETVTQLKVDIAAAKGRMAMVENGDWGNASQGQVMLKPERFGANPPQGLVNLQSQASAEVMSACGFNPALFQAGDSASLRESWRLALFGVVAPLGRMVQRELQDKIDPDVTLAWQELRASDLSGRARAMQSMVGAGMELSQAVAISGLMVEE